MKITGTSSHITIEINGKTLKAEGEMLVGGFAAYTDTMTAWEPPDQADSFDEAAKQAVIDAVRENTKNSTFKIEFI